MIIPQPLVSPEQVEGIEPGLATPEQQVFELRFAVAVEAHDFAVEHGRTAAELRLGLP
jgi:hypothetical protein